MPKRPFRIANWSVGSKISAFSFALVGVIIGALVLTISATTSSLLEERADHNVSTELNGLVATVELFNKTVGALLGDVPGTGVPHVDPHKGL